MLNGLIRKPLILVPIVMAMAIGLVSILAWVAMEPLNKKNGFDRSFLPIKLIAGDVVANPGLNDLSGVTENQLYFQTKNPSKILVTDYHLQNAKELNISVPYNNKITPSTVIIDSPNIKVLAGRLPLIIESQFQSLSFSSFKFPSSIFSRIAEIGPNSYVFRGFDTTTQTADQIFYKGNPTTGVIVRENNISEKNGDGGISTDGSLSYDKKQNLLIYTFYFRNQFLCLDTNLNLVYKGLTIDRSENMEIKSEQTKASITAVTPKRLVNASGQVSDGMLFICSMLKGDVESADQFRNNSVIDIYEVKTGKYRGSFYIPVHENERMYRFRFVDDKIVVFYKKHIMSYHLDLKAIN